MKSITQSSKFPKVSVIVPVYNVEQYLPQCLLTIIHQTLEDIEIILVNDGSTDCSLEICEKAAELDDRIIVLNQKNQGQSSARNLALNIATGEYVCFIDSDDYVSLNYLESLYNHASYNDCELACIHHTIWDYSVDANKDLRIGATKIQSGIYEMNEKIFADKDSLYRMTAGKVWKRELIEKLNLRFLVGKVREDEHFFWCMLPFVKKFAVVPEAFYFYRQRPGSTMAIIHDAIKQHDTRCAAHLLDVFHDIVEHYTAYNLLSNYKLPFFLLAEEAHIQKEIGNVENILAIKKAVKDYANSAQFKNMQSPQDEATKLARVRKPLI